MSISGKTVRDRAILSEFLTPQDGTTVSYAKGKIFNLVFLPLRYSAGDTYCGSGLVTFCHVQVVFRQRETEFWKD